MKPLSRTFSRWSPLLTLALAVAVLGCCCPSIPLPLLAEAPLRQVRLPADKGVAPADATLVSKATMRQP